MSELLSPSINAIINAAANEYGLTSERILSRERKADVAEARQAVMLMLQELFGYTTAHIGEILDRHHSSVVSGLQSIRNHISTEAHTRRRVERIRSVLLN